MNRRSGAGVLFLFCGAYYVAQASYGPYLNAYLASRGVDTGQIGLLCALAAATSLLSQPLWALFSDKTLFRRAAICALGLGAAGSMLVFGNASGFVAFCACYVAFNFFLAPILPLGDSIISENAKRRGIDFSWIRLTGTISYALVVYLLGALFAKDAGLMFPICAATLAIVGICALLLPKTQKATRADEIPGAESDEILPAPAGEMAFLLISSLICFTLISVSFGYTGILIVDIGCTQAQIGVANTISALSEVPILLVCRRLYRRFGAKMMYIALIACCARVWLYTMGSIGAIYAGHALQGACYMIAYYCQVAYLTQRTPLNKRAGWFAKFGMTQSGFSAILGNLLGGYVARLTGIVGMYRVYALAGVAAVAALAYFGRTLWVKNKKGVSH